MSVANTGDGSSIPMSWEEYIHRHDNIVPLLGVIDQQIRDEEQSIQDAKAALAIREARTQTARRRWQEARQHVGLAEAKASKAEEFRRPEITGFCRTHFAAAEKCLENTGLEGQH